MMNEDNSTSNNNNKKERGKNGSITQQQQEKGQEKHEQVELKQLDKEKSCRASAQERNAAAAGSSFSSSLSSSSSDNKELTVCDIIGDMGAYQISLTFFALLYSALAGINVVVGPVWTPSIRHLCVTPQMEANLHLLSSPTIYNSSSSLSTVNSNSTSSPSAIGLLADSLLNSHAIHSLSSGNFNVLWSGLDESAKCYLSPEAIELLEPSTTTTTTSTTTTSTTTTTTTTSTTTTTTTTTTPEPTTTTTTTTSASTSSTTTEAPTSSASDSGTTTTDDKLSTDDSGLLVGQQQATQEVVAPMDKRQRECKQFIYDDEAYGKVLTNKFDLVCSRQWLRSFPSSSALAGMLLSSVTLGILADKYGRMSCIKLGVGIALLATLGAVVAPNYILLNLCFLLISYAQVGVANGLCTLLMEATSPKWRFVPVFQYGLGWGLGMLLVPLIHSFTMNYQYFLLVLFVFQLVMLIWLKFGVFESIRWLLSEGKINQAQIELQRAARMNRVLNGTELWQKIAQVQVQQVRKASCIISEKTAPSRLAQATNQQEVESVAQELNMLGSAIRRSFAFDTDDYDSKSSSPFQLMMTEPQPTHGGAVVEPQMVDVIVQNATKSNLINSHHQSSNDLAAGELNKLRTSSSSTTKLSPTLTKNSFSLTTPGPEGHFKRTANNLDETQEAAEQIILGQLSPDERHSVTTQALVQLALKYSKTLQKQEEGTFFLTQMFHKKLYKSTIVLTLLSVMFETSYYGLIQTNGFVGSSISLNYITGACSEWCAALTYIFLLHIFSRRIALLLPTLLTALVCIGLALSYNIIPDTIVGEYNGLNGKIHNNNNNHNSHLHHHPENFLRHHHHDQQQEAQNKDHFLHQVNITGSQDQVDTFITNNSFLTEGSDPTPEDVPINPIVLQSLAPTTTTSNSTQQLEQAQMLQFRDKVTFCLTTFGKLTVTVGIQIAATIAMEAYPNNLRQTGPGVIVFVGRICSIFAPFLFNDQTPEKNVFKLTLVAIASFGFLVSILIPFFVRDSKNKELSDRLNEIED